MPWNGSGTYSPPAASFPEVNGTVIDAGRYNPTINDLAAGITNCLAKDGQNAATANIPMGGFKFTNMANAAGAGEAVVYGQTLPNLTVTNYLNVSSNIVWAPTQILGAGNANLAVKTSVGLGGGLMLVTGSDLSGAAWARLYLLAIRQFGGGGALITALQVSSVGPGTPPTIVFSDSGGFVNVAISGASANQTYICPIGGLAAS